MVRISVLINGRVVANIDMFGTVETIAPSTWEEIIREGVERERARQVQVSEGMEQLELDIVTEGVV